MRKFEVALLPHVDLAAWHVECQDNQRLLDEEQMKHLLTHQEEIPEDLRVFDLVLPRATRFVSHMENIFHHDVIFYLVWDGVKWIKQYKMNGAAGWMLPVDREFGPRGRLLKLA